MEGEALVGGSYLLLQESAVVKSNLCGPKGTEVTKVSFRQTSFFSYSFAFRTNKKVGIGFPTHGCLLAVARRGLKQLRSPLKVSVLGKTW